MKIWFKKEERTVPPEQHTEKKRERLKKKYLHRIKRELSEFKKHEIKDVHMVYVEMEKVEVLLNPRRERRYRVSGYVLIPRDRCTKVTDRQARKYTPGGMDAGSFSFEKIRWGEFVQWLGDQGVDLSCLK